MAATLPPLGSGGWTVMIGNQLPSIGDVTLACFGIVGGPTIGTFGYRLFRPVTTWMVGFMWLAGLLYSLLHHYESDRIPDYGAILIAVASGVAFGTLSAAVWQLGMVLLGAAGAVVTGMVLLSLKDGGLFGHLSWLAYFFLCMLALGGAGAILFLQRLGIIVASALLGSFGLTVGVMAMAAPHEAIVQINRAVLMDRWTLPPIEAGWPTYVAAAVFALLALLCVGVQLKWTAYIVSWKHHDPWRQRVAKNSGLQSLQQPPFLDDAPVANR